VVKVPIPCRAAIATRAQGKLAAIVAAAIFVSVGAASAQEKVVVERTLTQPAAWWFYYDVTPRSLAESVAKDKARIVDLDVDNASPLRLSAALVANSGAYASSWWWYHDLDAQQVADKLEKHKTRLLSIDPYMVDGKLRFAAVMVPNSGQQAVDWWWYYDLTPQQLSAKLGAHKARLVDIKRYRHGDLVRYAAIMVSNQGAKASTWWWYLDQTAAQVSQRIDQHKARLLDMERYGTGANERFDIILVPNAGSSAVNWWWHDDLSGQELLEASCRHGARLFDVEAPQDHAAGYAGIMIDNSAAGTVHFDPSVFKKDIDAKFAGNVKGYAFVVANAGCIVGKVSGGYAQAPGDGNVKMKTYIASGTGSVAKVFSGIALLHLLAEHKLSNASIDKELDTPIWGMLPPAWQHAYTGRNLELITYRELLQHKSGFRIGDGEASKNTTGTKLTYVLDKGVKKSDIDHREYNNFNYAILGILIPAIAYPDEVKAIDDKYQNLDPAAFAKAVQPLYGRLYERYMLDVIFPKTVESVSITCKPKGQLAANRYAKWYGSKNDDKGGVIDSDYCRSQGAWMASAQDLSTFARTYEFTTRYFGPEVRTLLFHPTPADPRDDDRLVYDSPPVENTDFGKETGQSYWPWHGGDQDGYHAAVVRLPYGYVGVGMINSSDFSSPTLARAIVDAFYDATR
jgi:Beta-lactamase/Polyglycine hydrolase-like, structural repeat